MYVDSDILLGLIKPNDRFEGLARRLMSLPERQYTSVISLVELEFVISREISSQASMHVGEIFRKVFPRIELMSLDEKTVKQSLELRVLYDLGVIDSIHVAIALQNDSRIASTDQSFDRVSGLTRVQFD